MHTQVNRFARLTAVAVLSSLAIIGPVAARESVDPSLLNPPPPDFFNATCFTGAGGVVCDLHFSDDPIVDEPSGIICEGTELLFSQDRSVVGKRFYDADGNLVQRHFREDLSGTLSNPANDGVLDWIAQDTVLHNLAVPGDLATGTTAITGTPMRVFHPGGGTVLVDAGRVAIDAATEEIVSSHGPHHFDDYFARGDGDALDAICAALS